MVTTTPKPFEDDWNEAAGPEDDQTPERPLYERIGFIVGELTRLAEDQEARKLSVEERWLKNLRAYHGIYDAQTLKAIDAKHTGRSEIFVKLARHKTHSWQARLSDMLFPTEDRNWGILPTPLPTLGGEAAKAADERMRRVDEANAIMEEADAANQAGNEEQAQALLAQAQELEAQAKTAADAEAQIQAVIAEARERAKAMERTMDDQLVECRYGAEARDVIDDGCKLGTGVMLGPTVKLRAKRQWKQQLSGGASVWSLHSEPDEAPSFSRIDPWAFFPDMSARSAEEAEFFFIRFLPNKRMFRRLAREVGFEESAALEILRSSPNHSIPQYLQQLRVMNGEAQQIDARYHVWCYYGPLQGAQLRDLLEAVGDLEALAAVEDETLEEQLAIVWFCENRLLKIGLHPLDSGDPLISVWNFERDEASIFGFGVPHLMEGSQDAINGAWRMMLDNGGLSVGPQILIDGASIKPQDGDWGIRPNKVWLADKSWPSGSRPMDAFNIPNNLTNLALIIEQAMRFADDETNMPIIAQGEQASHVTNTMGGMSMLMNSANVVFRRVVKSFDDDFTTPNIRRLYDWNMQFNPDENVKGDFQVDARGSSVLLVREVQAQNLLLVAERWSTHPVLGPMLSAKGGGLPAARKALQSMMITADELLPTEEEWQREQRRLASMPQQPSPEEMRLKAAEIDAASREKVATINQETTMMSLAEKYNMTMDQLAARLEEVRITTGSDERKLAVEIAVEARQAANGQAQPSGGAISSGDGGSGGTIG